MSAAVALAVRAVGVLTLATLAGCASRANNRSRESGALMGEELGPIYWRVWLLASPGKVRRVQAATRLAAVLKGAAFLGASAKLWTVDAEVERA